jgi:hypothetical protein
MILYTTTVLEISIGCYFIILKPTRFLSLKMRKNVPNNGQSIAEDMTSNPRHFLLIHLVGFGTWLYVWYVAVRLVRGCTFGTSGMWLYVWYVLVRFGTSACRVGFFDMKLSLFTSRGEYIHHTQRLGACSSRHTAYGPMQSPMLR